MGEGDGLRMRQKIEIRIEEMQKRGYEESVWQAVILKLVRVNL